MNILVPLVFSLLAVNLHSETMDDAPLTVTATDSMPFAQITAVDTVSVNDNIKVVAYDAVSTAGGSRRILMTVNDSGQPVGIMDGGSWGERGIWERLYITNHRHDTMTFILDIGDSDPRYTRAPEGGTVVEFTDRILLEVINHDNAETETLTLRDNQVRYKIDETGKLTLLSIRPKPDELRQATRQYMFYDTAGDADILLDANGLSDLLRNTFPVPGQIKSPGHNIQTDTGL